MSMKTLAAALTAALLLTSATGMAAPRGKAEAAAAAGPLGCHTDAECEGIDPVPADRVAAEVARLVKRKAELAKESRAITKQLRTAGY